jgi:hypothetical protein
MNEDGMSVVRLGCRHVPFASLHVRKVVLYLGTPRAHGLSSREEVLVVAPCPAPHPRQSTIRNAHGQHQHASRHLPPPLLLLPPALGGGQGAAPQAGGRGAEAGRQGADRLRQCMEHCLQQVRKEAAITTVGTSASLPCVI